MIEKSKNKMMQEAPSAKAVEHYHFAGSGIYVPQTVTASSSEEATEIWKNTRREVKPISIPKTENEDTIKN